MNPWQIQHSWPCWAIGWTHIPLRDCPWLLITGLPTAPLQPGFSGVGTNLENFSIFMTNWYIAR